MDLASNNLHLICRKSKPNQNKTNRQTHEYSMTCWVPFVTAVYYDFIVSIWEIDDNSNSRLCVLFYIFLHYIRWVMVLRRLKLMEISLFEQINK